MTSTHPFPIVEARAYAAGAVDALSVADGYWLQDDPRVDLTLDEALAGLDEARKRVQALRDQRRTRRPALAAAVALATMVLPWAIDAGVAHAAIADAATAGFRWNGLSLLAVVTGLAVILFIPIRSRK